MSPDFSRLFWCVNLWQPLLVVFVSVSPSLFLCFSQFCFPLLTKSLVWDALTGLRLIPSCLGLNSYGYAWLCRVNKTTSASPTPVVFTCFIRWFLLRVLSHYRPCVGAGRGWAFLPGHPPSEQEAYKEGDIVSQGTHFLYSQPAVSSPWEGKMRKFHSFLFHDFCFLSINNLYSWETQNRLFSDKSRETAPGQARGLFPFCPLLMKETLNDFQ